MARAATLSFLAFLLFAISPAKADRYAGEFTVTAYCSCRKCCGRDAQGITASGKHVRSGMIAADWGVLPKGTRVSLSILPNRILTVEDTGSAIKGNRIDVWLPSHQAAVEFGIHHDIKVWVVPKPRRAPGGSADAGLARLR